MPLGLNAIHVNRVLRQLRERKLLTLSGRKVIIHDPVALKSWANIRTGSPVLGIDPMHRAITSADANSDQRTARDDIL
jgi:hypothetical protein